MRNDPLSIRRKGYGPNTWRNIQIINTGLEENRKLYGKKDILTVFHTLACLWMHFVPVSIYLINQFPQITPIYLTTIVQNRYYTKKKKLKLLFIFFMIIFQISSKLFQFLSRTSFIFISISYQMVRSPGNTNFQKFLFDLSSHYFIPILRDLSFDLSIY